MGQRSVSLLAAALLAAPAFPQASNDHDGEAIDAEAAEERGFDYLFGRGVERDPAQAAQWLEQAAAAGRPYAGAALAELYVLGRGVPADGARAHELILTAARAGIGPSQTSLGLAYARADSFVERDFPAALQWLNAAAEQEDPRALAALGGLYRFGVGVAQDSETWLRLVTRAAELGYAPSAVETALYLLDEDAATADVQRALHFLRGAASSSYAPGAYALGKVYLHGELVERDTDLAVQWLTRASELKFSLGTAWLAELYDKGIGVTADPARAAQLREQALAAMSVGDRNELAWELAVSPRADLRNGPWAVEIGESVTAERPSAAYIDTLAAAYAEAGRFEDAVRAQQRAADALPGTVSAATRDSYAARVELYRSRGTYRESP